MFKELGKTLKAVFRAVSKGAQATEQVAGAAKVVGEGLEESTQILKEDFIEDLKIDQEVDRAKRAKRKAKAMAKIAVINAELAELNESLPEEFRVAV